MKYYQLLAISLISLYSCKQDEPRVQKTSDFQIHLAGGETITFYNPECEFNIFAQNQAQFNGSSSVGYSVFSTYWNSYSMDSTINQIWIDLLIVPSPPNELYNLDSLPKILAVENNSTNNEHLQVNVQMEINGKRYDNQLWDTDPNTPPWENSDSLYFEIEEYEIFFNSECLNRELLYLKFQIEGKLYASDFFIKTDSIEINMSEMKLLFAAD
ncbi:MAG: hypothetical protein IPL92_05945 [Saprospiraceae bacterium]|nr:hypothetical protein [Candidatus Opimibacter iunctus]